MILKPFKNEEWQIETIIKMTVRLPLTHLPLAYTIKLFTLVVVNKLVRFTFTFQVKYLRVRLEYRNVFYI